MKNLLISFGILTFLIGIGYLLMELVEAHKNPDVAATDKIAPSFFENEGEIKRFR